jgi:hypothetical protein
MNKDTEQRRDNALAAISNYEKISNDDAKHVLMGYLGDVCIDYRAKRNTPIYMSSQQVILSVMLRAYLDFTNKILKSIKENKIFDELAYLDRLIYVFSFSEPASNYFKALKDEAVNSEMQTIKDII